MANQCPVCGSPIPPEMIPAVRTISFECSSCRNQLQAVKPERMDLFVVTVTLSIAVILLLQIRGFTLILAIIATALVLSLLGNFLLSVIVTPKLERSRPKPKAVHLPRQIRRAH